MIYKMSDDAIRKEIELFQSSVMKLSGEVGKAGMIWNDPKYSELSSSVSQIANESKDVILAGDRCCASIGKMEKIASEKY